MGFKTKVEKMATRRRSMAVLPNPGNVAPARSTSSRRASSAFAAPAPALDKPKTGRVTKKRATAPVAIPKAPKDDSFVSGDMFDFIASPKGPMTRARRSSMFLGAPNRGLPVTSTARKSAVKSKKLESVMETPEVSFVQKPKKSAGRPKKDSSLANKENLRETREVISPIKQAAISRAFGPSATSTSAKKPKLALPKVKQQNSVVPGTPQPMDPSNILKRNLKKTVEAQLDKKVQEIPKSPYKLLMGETENGSPVEHFVKMAKKPSKENVTGTPAPVRRSARKVFTPIMDNNVQGSPHPNPMQNRLGTPKKLDMTNEAMEVETENQAINKVMAKTSTSPTVAASNQMITGDLAKLCTIM